MGVDTEEWHFYRHACADVSAMRNGNRWNLRPTRFHCVRSRGSVRVERNNALGARTPIARHFIVAREVASVLDFYFVRPQPFEPGTLQVASNTCSLSVQVFLFRNSKTELFTYVLRTRKFEWNDNPRTNPSPGRNCVKVERKDPPRIGMQIVDLLWNLRKTD